MQKILFMTVAALVLTGCQTTTHNPYRWQYAGDKQTVCLEMNEGTEVSLMIPLRQALADKGIKVVSDDAPGVCAKRLLFSAEMGGWSGADVKKAQLVLTEVSEEGAMAPVTGYRVTMENTAESGALDAPASDSASVIRTLVDRMLPDPKPWNPD